MENETIRTLIIEALESERHRQASAALGSREEATDEDSRSEGKFDMRGQTAAYLAEGQARLAGETADAIKAFQALVLPLLSRDSPVQLGTLVDIETDGGRSTYFMGPASGGLEITRDSRTITVITPGSGIGRQLIGKRAGDRFSTPVRGGQKTHTVAAVR